MNSNEYASELHKKYFNLHIDDKAELSSGICEIGIPNLYHDYILDEMEHSGALKRYTFYPGYLPLLSIIKLYEKALATENLINISDTYCNNVALTLGATGGLYGLFMYFHQAYPKGRVLLIGMNYWYINEICSILNVNVLEAISKEENRINPSINEIIDIIQRQNIDMVLLVSPANPSGEIYKEQEVVSLLKIIKEKNILFCLDKCQSDEFNVYEKYINFNKIIVSENYESKSIIINSLSKTRCVPGLRFGYIIAEGNIFDEISKFIVYNLPISIYCYAITSDFLYRLMFYFERFHNYIDVKIINRIYKIFIKNIDYYHDYEHYISIVSEKIMLDYLKFKSHLLHKWKNVTNNYNLTTSILSDFIKGETKLEGGFNYCVKITNPKKISDYDFCLDVLLKKHLLVLSQCCFTHTKSIVHDDFYIRLSLSVPPEEYKRRLMMLKKYLEYS